MKTMKRIAIALAALLIAITASAQVGRYKSIKIFYPGYSFKLDTATGELWAVHYDNDAEVNIEEQILSKQSHNKNQTGRYEFRRTRQIGTYQVFDTSTGDYITVKWKPKNKDGEDIDQEIENTVSNVMDHLINALDNTRNHLDSIRNSRQPQDTVYTQEDMVLEEIL